ncbi:MAG TPA: thiamine pyrophosphate-dependent dehydrogenase E1 component subunit alpha [Methylomirabilota bacterium]|nr:thiamine pyrophosphate-dependent dehydrogenase E1 component subunit alpha [Methylomirabilota bacterium]
MTATEAPSESGTSGLHLAIYRDMVRSRLLSDRMFTLNRQGRAAFAITGQGHEAAQVASAYAIDRGTDWVLPYYRDVGVMVALGMSPYDILLGLFARPGDLNSGGRQMPCHWSWPAMRVVTRSSVIAANLPHAAGVAYASKLRGLSEATIVYFGEGATSEGDFHEAVNFAAIHRLPVLFFCENNGYAISESQEKQMSVLHVADRAKGYGIEGQTLDGNDAVSVYQATRWSLEECRRGLGPKLVEAKTYRYSPHTSSDDDRRYRPRSELEEWIKKDPIDRLRKRLLEDGALADDEDQRIRDDARREVDDAVQAAEQAPDPPPEEALRYVFAEEEP